jgi:hypothetical protein
MSAPQPIVIHAEVDLRERPAVVAGVQQLSEALHAAAGVAWPIQLTFWDQGAISKPQPDGVVVLSLMADAERDDEAFGETAARWRSRIEALTAEGAPVLALTLFRAVAERDSPSGQRRLERIRRLDRMTLDLSHTFGLTVVDIDRAFAHIGARTLGTDYQLNGRIAAEVGGHALTLCLLTLGLDDTIPPEVQERARGYHGPLRQIDTLVRRRLAAG